MRHRDYHHLKKMEHHPRIGIGLPVSRSGYKHLKEELNF